MFAFDPLYLGLILVTIVISATAQALVHGTFRRYDAIGNSRGMTGSDVAIQLARANAAQGGGRAALASMGIAISPGTLSDHFDPRLNEIGLSPEVATTASIAAMAVAAHEVGHAQQHADRSPLMAARSILVPAVSVSPTVSYVLILMGLLFDATGLIMVGVIFFGLAVVFALLTVPIEVNASRRGLAMLDQLSMLPADADRVGARRVLTAAAFTYIAAAVTAVLQLLYYLSLARRRG
jgi:Zn-dependent membrane protease YugP